MNSPSDTEMKWRRRAIASIILNLLFVFMLARLAKHVPRMEHICESRDLEELNAIVEDGSFVQAVPLASPLVFKNRYASGWAFPIHWAAAKANPDAIRLFLEAHVDPNTLDSEGETPINWLMGNLKAPEGGLLECLRLLVSHGADINLRTSRDYPGYTVLHFAARLLETRNVTLLCEFGADVNARDSHGNTPLHLSAAEGTGSAEGAQWESTLRELVKCGADIAIKNHAGDRAIDVVKKTKRGYSIDHEIETLLTPK